MFNNTLSPFIINWGLIRIRYYGLVYALGFLSLLLLLEFLRKRRYLDITEDENYSFVMYIMIFSVGFARLFDVFFWQPGYYLHNPLKILAFWEGGMAIHGGIIGAVLGAYLFFRGHKDLKRRGINFWLIADLVTPLTAFFISLGRVANYINNELVGTVTNVPWCVVFQGYAGCRHPAQLYDGLGRFISFIILTYFFFRVYGPQLRKKGIRANRLSGRLFIWMIILTSLSRIITDVWKDDPRFFGFTLGQYYSLIFLAVSFFLLWLLKRNSALGRKGHEPS